MSLFGDTATLQQNLVARWYAPARLRQLLPARAGTLRQLLEIYSSAAAILNLLNTHFPAHYSSLQLRRQGCGQHPLLQPDTISEVARYFYRLVEKEDWFKIDWPHIEMALDYFERDYDSYPYDTGWFDLLLVYMPIKVYGWYNLDESVEVMVTLHDLLRADSEEQAIWQSLRQIEYESGNYPANLIYLPVIGRWSVGCSGNPILDTDLGVCAMGNPRSWVDAALEGGWFTWPNHLEEIKDAWRHAQPIIEAYRKLERWATQSPGNMDKLATFIKTGEGSNELVW